jgi:hypothetical protein
MQSNGIDPVALGFTIVSLSVALEETLKALAEKNGNHEGSWLEEVQDLALLRAEAWLTDATDKDAAAAAIAVVEAVFARLPSGLAT